MNFYPIASIPMLHTFTALQGAEHFLLMAARLWAAAGELITAGAILWSLDTLARAIRAAYAAGRFVGRLLWPAIHFTAATLRLIDWQIVAAVVIDCLKVLAVAAYVAAVMARRGLINASAAMGRRYAATVAPAVAAAPAAYHPAAMIAGELSTLTCAQLRALTGCRRKIRKADLIALAIAA
jgi:hypothetical protein